MKKFIAWLTLVLGVLLVVFAWTLGYADTSALWQDFIVGLVIIGVSLFAILTEEGIAVRVAVPRQRRTRSVARGLGHLRLRTGGGANRVVDIVLGVVVIVLSVFASQVVEGKKGYVYTKDGSVLLEMSRLGYKDGSIEAKGKAYGSMPQTMRIPPEQIWNLIGLVPLEVIVRLPVLLLRGWLKSRSATDSKAAGWKST